MSSVAAAAGIDELVDALDAHRAALDLAAARTRARRLGALADFVSEHGERGLRALGGRRAAERWLAEQDPGLDEPALVRAPRGRSAVRRSRRPGSRPKEPRTGRSAGHVQQCSAPVRFIAYALIAAVALHVAHGLLGVDLGVPAAVFDDWIYNGVLVARRSSAPRARCACARSGSRGR